jgi:Ca2+-binding RTX toxin-like protein
LIYGGAGNDVIYGGPGDDFTLNGDEGDDVVYGGEGDDEELYGDGDLRQGEDVIYGGDGNDTIYASGDGQRDRLYCGEGIDHYAADKVDYLSSSCEKKTGILIVD